MEGAVDNPSPPGSTLSEWINNQKVYRNVPSVVSNELLQRLALPEDARCALPKFDTTVLDILLFECPAPILQLISPKSRFSKESPNTSLQSLLHCPMPTLEFVSKLRELAGQAMLDGHVSILDWTRRNVYLPFSAITFWLSIIKILDVKKKWKRALDWMNHCVRQK